MIRNANVSVGKQIMTESRKSDNSNPFSKVFDPAVELYSRGIITGFASFWFGKIDNYKILYGSIKATTYDIKRLSIYALLISLFFSFFHVALSTETN